MTRKRTAAEVARAIADYTKPDRADAASLPALTGPQCPERFHYAGEVVRCLLDQGHDGRCLVALWSRP